MFASRILSIAFALALSTAAVAQEAPAPTAAPAVDATATTPRDCTKPMARHDHGAERGTPTPMSAGCPMAIADTSAKTKAKLGHDHAKFHKLM
jgi:hypothetical protein